MGMKGRAAALGCASICRQVWCCLLAFFTLWPQGGAAQDKTALPEPVARELKRADIPVEAVGIYVQPLSDGGAARLPVFALNEDTPYMPASTMKVVTTYSALEILGPAYRWKTAVYARGSIDGEVLNGDLIFKGGGDPAFRLEDLWVLLQRLRSRGIRDIRGDLVLDRGVFEERFFDPGAFDNDPFKPYNAGPDALLLNQHVVEVLFRPDGLEGTVHVQTVPEMDGVAIVPPALTDTGRCQAWQQGIKLHFSEREAVFDGEYPLACGDQTWLVSPATMDRSAFFRAVFAGMWKALGGSFSGGVRESRVDGNAYLLEEWQSSPLSEVVRDINKYSNNVMARQVLITAGSPSLNEPASPEKGAFAIRAFLASRGISIQDLYIENGSGLSRIERISPRTMGDVLAAAYRSAVMPELMASLPVAGRDGTLAGSMRQSSVAGKAHLKTGSIQDVRAIAGYVLAASGQRYAVVFIVNHSHAALGSRARDALLEWVHDRG
ncbi:MAG: D-alanyl-D-alanine carboxypeptidase/D-alanyl-D-alanine-endopeptidase [Oxalobacter formigenes]|nr:D-alanyl-D-alanine carboxypeptidase/D-alanyl-D-alanine-endopeptidase [Oxalobacter formigenes]